MKSSYITSTNDPFGSTQPLLLEGLKLDCKPSLNEYHFDTDLGDPLGIDNWVNYSDSQLEDILRDGPLCGDFESLVLEPEEKDATSNVADVGGLVEDDAFNKPSINDEVDNPIMHEDVQFGEPVPDMAAGTVYEAQNSPFQMYNDGIARYEEVYANNDFDVNGNDEFALYNSQENDFDCSVSDNDNTVIELADEKRPEDTVPDDQESLNSYVTCSSVSSPKRKLSSIDSGVTTAPGTATSRTLRKRRRPIADEKIKYQNKVAAVRYRIKKREERDQMDDMLKREENRYKELKEQQEELQVQIQVLKELLANYLPRKLSS